MTELEMLRADNARLAAELVELRNEIIVSTYDVQIALATFNSRIYALRGQLLELNKDKSHEN